MNILCVYSFETYVDVQRPLMGWTDIPYGLATIAAQLEHKGHRIDTLVICPATPLPQTVSRFLAECRPGMVAFTAVTSQFPIIAEVAAEFRRQAPELFLVLGGHHATLVPDHAIGASVFDAICIGEGDHVAPALAAALEAGQRPAGIPGLWIRDRVTGEIDRTPPEPFLQDLDNVPFINRQHWERWINNPEYSSVVVIGRGCPYSCTYCSNHALKKVSTGKYVRIRSPENILAEIAQILDKHPKALDIYLEIETIGAFPQIAIKLADALEAFNADRAEPVSFGVNLAVTTRLVNDRATTEAMLESFHRANIRFINIGLESGSESMREKILRRPRYTNDDLAWFCQTARSYGIKINLYVLVGLPDETPADFAETVAVTRRCNPDKVFLGIFYPYPGTDLHRLAADRGYFDPNRIDSRAERSRAVLNMPMFSARRIFLSYIFFHFLVYRGIWPARKIFVHTVRPLIRSFPWLHSLVKKTINSNRLLLTMLGRYKMVRVSKTT